MTRPAAWLLAAALLAAALAASAPARSGPRLSAADRRAIGNLIDRFVKDAVRRENLAAAWKLAGPDLRAGTTRAAWVKGTGVTVPYYPALGNDFRHAWTGRLVEPGRAVLAVILHPKPGSRGYEETAASVDVRKIAGRWVVDLFYSSAVFHANGGVEGPSDYGPGGGGGGTGPDRHIRGGWLLIGIGAAGGSALLAVLGLVARAKLRERRAWADYVRAGGTARRRSRLG